MSLSPQKNGLLEIFHPKRISLQNPKQPDENFSGSNLKRLGAKPLPELRQKEAPAVSTPQFFGPQKGKKNVHLPQAASCIRITLPETNSSHLKIGQPKRKRESIPTIHFQVQAVSFREGTFFLLVFLTCFV